MTLHFSYGSNMSRALMRARCPGAAALGVATLAGWRFVVNPDGVGSIAPHPGEVLHGVLWRLTLRDLAAINAYENVDTQLYIRRRVAVRFGNQQMAALVFIARRRGEGRPRPGYISLVVEAARDWQFPVAYVESLQRWSPSGWRGASAKDTGELG